MSEEQIHWHHTVYDWNGECFTFQLGHELEGAPARWLDRNLEDRLAQVPGMAGVEVRVSEASWANQRMVAEGCITFTRISTPWPDAQSLRQHLTAAVREANQTADVALGEIRRFADQWNDLTSE